MRDDLAAVNPEWWTEMETATEIETNLRLEMTVQDGTVDLIHHAAIAAALALEIGETIVDLVLSAIGPAQELGEMTVAKEVAHDPNMITMNGVGHEDEKLVALVFSPRSAKGADHERE